VLARLLANQLNIRKSESLFIIGLLHEIGHLIIYSKYPGHAKQVIANLPQGSQMIHEAEQKLLGFHYGQMGARLMAQWQLPLSFQIITYYQPTTFAPDHQLGTALVHIAHGYAQHYFSDAGQSLEELILPNAWETLNLLPEQIEATLEKAQVDSSEMEQIILK